MEAVGSSMKIDETWSMEVLRVEAFSEGVVAPFQYTRAGGSSSLLGEAGKREKVVAFCRWVPACWYESAPVHGCKKFSL